jgi:hypothetical protein
MPGGRNAMLFDRYGSIDGFQDWLAGTLALAYLGGSFAAVEFALVKLVF